jgi:hypothetical protein
MDLGEVAYSIKSSSVDLPELFRPMMMFIGLMQSNPCGSSPKHLKFLTFKETFARGDTGDDI